MIDGNWRKHAEEIAKKMEEKRIQKERYERKNEQYDRIELLYAFVMLFVLIITSVQFGFSVAKLIESYAPTPAVQKEQKTEAGK